MRRWHDKVELMVRLGFLIAPVVLLLLPADFFDYGASICLYRRLLQVECPGCGLTRATQHLIHGEWHTALAYNPLVLVTTPILLWLWWQNIRWFWRKGYTRQPADLPASAADSAPSQV